MILDAAERPPAPACPSCQAPLSYVDTEASFDKFRPDAATPSTPHTPIHHYDCQRCRKCWTLGEALEPDLVRQIRKGEEWATAERPIEQQEVDPLASSRILIVIGLCAVPSVVFILSILFDSYAPRSVYSGRQWLINGVGRALAGGIGLSIVLSPFAVLGTIWNFRRLTPRDQIIAVVFALIALVSPALVVLFFFGISQIR